MKKMRNGVVWITGLSASGKTTISTSLYSQLKSLGFVNLVLLDGEELRRHSSREFGYSVEERIASSMEDYETIKKYKDNDILTIIATISPQKKVREKAREIFKDFIEVYLECPVDICAERDYKDHYRRAFSGELDNFVGVTQEYQKSDYTDLVLNTSERSIDDCTETLTEFVVDRFEMQ